MDRLVMIGWLLLALIHASPAAALFAPGLIERLYAMPAVGDIGLLLQHRAALFLAVVGACGIAAFHLPSRKLATVVVAISMLTFLWLYLRGGSPERLRTIFIADLVGLVPLALVTWDAWIRHARG
jgi:hypothetical protein